MPLPSIDHKFVGNQQENSFSGLIAKLRGKKFHQFDYNLPLKSCFYLLLDIAPSNYHLPLLSLCLLWTYLMTNPICIVFLLMFLKFNYLYSSFDVRSHIFCHFISWPTYNLLLEVPILILHWDSLFSIYLISINTCILLTHDYEISTYYSSLILKNTKYLEQKFYKQHSIHQIL